MARTVERRSVSTIRLAGVPFGILGVILLVNIDTGRVYEVVTGVLCLMVAALFGFGIMRWVEN